MTILGPSSGVMPIMFIVVGFFVVSGMLAYVFGSSDSTTKNRSSKRHFFGEETM